jgi:hypothetical protein
MCADLEGKKADIPAAPPADRGETIGLMEPLLIGESSPRRGEVTDLAVDLAAKSAGFRRGLPNGVLAALADLVRAMNCYYSNLIEGPRHPPDRHRARAQERLQCRCTQARPPTRSQSAYRGATLDR